MTIPTSSSFKRNDLRRQNQREDFKLHVDTYLQKRCRTSDINLIENITEKDTYHKKIY